MTTKPKTKRDRSAGRAHRHTAIQTIIDNHQGFIASVVGIDNHIAALQGRTCDLGLRLDNWCDRLEEQNKHTRQNVAYTMRCVVENERKAAEVESAVGILQESSKEHQGDIAILKEVAKQQMPINAKQVTINKMTHDVQKEQQKAIAQLIAYTNKVHEKQTNLNRELNHTRAAVDEVRDDLMWFGRLLIGLSATTILAYLILFLIVIAK